MLTSGYDYAYEAFDYVCLCMVYVFFVCNGQCVPLIACATAPEAVCSPAPTSVASSCTTAISRVVEEQRSPRRGCRNRARASAWRRVRQI